jgi:predicted DNA-binding transcriptional regulator AlpA
MSTNPHVAERDETIALIAAMVNGDRWLSADSCWVFLGLKSKRVFLERVACNPSFPIPSKPAGTSVWRKSEVDTWADRQRINRAA